MGTFNANFRNYGNFVFDGVKEYRDYYSSISENGTNSVKFISCLAQSRVDGEQKYIEYIKYDGCFDFVFNSVEDEALVNVSIDRVKDLSEIFDITIHT